MFKLEVKKINLKSIVFSGYPFVVFVFSLLTTLFSLGDVVSPGEGVFSSMISILLYVLVTAGVIVIYSLLAAFIYNTLTNFGMKGLRFSLTEVEEDNAESEAVAPAEENNEK